MMQDCFKNYSRTQTNEDADGMLTPKFAYLSLQGSDESRSLVIANVESLHVLLLQEAILVNLGDPFLLSAK